MEALKKNHYELLGLSKCYALDPAALEKSYLALQQAIHPDRFASAGETQKRLAMQLAAQVNEAFQTLRDPGRRAAYLCHLAGVDVALESNTAMPADFLMLQMEWREALDEAHGDEAAMMRLRAQAQAKALELQMQTQAALDERQDYVQAAGFTRQLAFVEKFLQDLNR